MPSSSSLFRSSSIASACSNASIAIDANQIISGTIASARISGSYTGITGVGTLTVGTWNAATIATAYGGTGLSTFVANEIFYASSTSTMTQSSKLLFDGNILTSTGGIGGGNF